MVQGHPNRVLKRLTWNLGNHLGFGEGIHALFSVHFVLTKGI